MASSRVISLLSILLLYITIAQGRKTLYTSNDFSASSLDPNDGICKTMVETQGYICEEHKVTTEDGYILSVQRLPASRSADSGFDVWLVNGRGTKYSTMHTSLSPNDKGTLMAFATLSQGQLLNMLRSAALLSPIAHMNQISSKETKLGADLFLANDIYWLGIREFSPIEDVGAKFLDGICHTLNLNCANLMAFFTVIRTGNIAKYDYDDQAQNVQHYGQRCNVLCVWHYIESLYHKLEIKYQFERTD
ncbi:hypothetical protein TSUD_181080 [Trifolium subterraneum]|uniref:Partial AB-hydrolase lipase domain-containing protein n=1 Tax=Trifolium subterraneum TaxID=3900 RepID=A0A2Z6MXW6_TRISU|nr:hypothetical protein TSUD_181080 [Trifolium subterraneum]